MKKHMLFKTIMGLVLCVSVLLAGSNAAFADDDSDYELEDIMPLKEGVCARMGEGTIVGAACTLDELNRNGVRALIEKHFNAVTLGNELKPDALFNYSNGQCPGTEEVELNGEAIVVPKMDYSRAEAMLDIIYDWNQANPDNIIMVRGHVLVWHSQTPEWFFHVDYDKNKDYVTPAEMTKRQEWYIKTVLEHFAGEDSKYKGMFYAWDVVNEAISDSTRTYRSDAENPNESLLKDTHGSNSSWWHVYQSNEYIINAFRFANKYAPAEVELYYNDYNDCDLAKALGITRLLEDVKGAEGTRIDGMGMQGHYSSGDLNDSNFKSAAKRYANTGVKIMVTEWDYKAPETYDSEDEESRLTEYTRQGHRYESLFNTMLKLKDGGMDIAGFTVWGTIDKLSWLQSRSDVGGGASGGYTQCPLIFDDNYHAKPAYWGLVDPNHVNDMINEYKERVKAEAARAEEPEVVEAAETETSIEAVEPVEAVGDPIETAADEKHTKRVRWISSVVIAAILGLASVICDKVRKKRAPRKKRR